MIWPFNNNSSWADKVEVHNNERKTSTYFTQAIIAQELEMGGRFAAESRASIVGEAPRCITRQRHRLGRGHKCHRSRPLARL